MKNSAAAWLWEVTGRKKTYIALLTAVQALCGASGVFFALLLKGIVDSAAGGDSAGFWRFILYSVLLVCVQQALRAVFRYLSERCRAEVENVLKSRLFGSILGMDILSFSAEHSGEWMNRLTNDTVVVAEGLAGIVPGVAEMAVKLICAIVMIIALQPRFSAILAVLGLLLILFSWVFRKRLKSLHKGVQEADGRLRSFLQEHLSSLFVIRSYAAEPQVEKAAGEYLARHRDARMRRNRFHNFCNVGFGLGMSGMYLLGAGWCGWGLLKGTVSFGELTAITQLITQIRMPFANISGFLPRWYAMLASAERLMEAEGRDKDVCAVPESLQDAKKLYNEDFSAFGLSGVSFSYGGENAVEGLSFEIGKGEYAAFTGQSGCGKTTAVKLLSCVYAPSGGERYYRDGSGLKKPLTPELRRLFAYVPQDDLLMSGTVRQAVSFADPDASGDDERIWDALRTACADGFVAALENGIDSVLGERGSGLSEGQMQRIAVARAVFSGSPILLLDEATSALDTDTEKRLLENLRALEGRTAVIVTHRPAALSVCDRVFRFTESGVAER